jgi:FtsZ-interacting cell division protein ZipA
MEGPRDGGVLMEFLWILLIVVFLITVIGLFGPGLWGPRDETVIVRRRRPRRRRVIEREIVDPVETERVVERDV